MIKSNIETKKEMNLHFPALYDKWLSEKELKEKFKCFMDYYEWYTGEDVRHY